MTDAARYTPQEEKANAAVHALGVVLSLIGLAVLIDVARQQPSPRYLVSAVVYGVSLLLMFAVSVAYHGTRRQPLKKRFRAADHCMIFLLIAGTYTPLALVSLHGTWGWLLLAAIWALALAGIAMKLWLGSNHHGVFVALYVAMGWCGIVLIRQLLVAVPAGGLWLLLAGGLAYTGGVWFYRRRSLRHHHAIWHTFVLVASALHFFAILLYVLPAQP
jgi:hemolysin III